MTERSEGVSRSTRAWLLVAAFAAGFAITGIEIALGRLLAPHFGSSLTVWAAIIASVIGALSIGYPLGGWMADRRPDATLPLYTLLVGGVLGTALGVALPLWLRTAMAGLGFTGAAFWGRLSLVLLLFAVPCILLATVAPSVLRVTLRDRTTAGRDAGWLYALGSVGSVIGILIPALWTIPVLGLRWTFFLIGGVALLSGGLGLIAVRRADRLPLVLLAGLVWMGSFVVPEGVRLPDQAGVQVLYDRDSGLQRIRVIAEDQEGNRRRWLQLNEGWSVHSWYLEPDYVTGDVWDWMALTALFPQPDDGRTDVLIVGLAAGTVSNLMTLVLEPLIPGLAITGIEIDSEVIAVADRYLGLDRSRLETVVADGRVWLRGSDAKFDLIILDAYRQPSIPAHLATVEYLEQVRDHLSPGGLAVMNVFGPAGRSRLLDGLGASWTHVFPNPQILYGPEFDGMASHLLFGGPAVPIDTRRHAQSEIPQSIREAWKLLQGVRSYRVDPEVALWTDDRAPVELLTDHAYRKLRPRNAEL